MAWNYLETKPNNVYISHETAREDLALIMMNLARSGERNPIKIANIAIDQMRQSEHPPINPKTARRMKATWSRSKIDSRTLSTKGAQILAVSPA